MPSDHVAALENGGDSTKTDDAQDGGYYALVNKNPAYRYGQKPMIDASYRGSMVTVDREGRITRSVPIADDDFGGLVVANGKFYTALMNRSEIIEFDPESGSIFKRIALPSPAGGLEYDPDRDAFVAHLYVGYPQLAIVDRQSGRIVENLWSEESVMGLAKVDGDWLSTWASGWDPGSFSELRIIDQKPGYVNDRIMLDEVHSSLAPIVPERDGFIALVTTDSASGQTVIRRYSYVSDRVSANAR